MFDYNELRKTSGFVDCSTQSQENPKKDEFGPFVLLYSFKTPFKHTLIPTLDVFARMACDHCYYRLKSEKKTVMRNSR